MQRQAAPPFERATRNKFFQMATLTRPAGGGSVQPVELPKTGFLARIFLRISVTTAGTITTSNAAGICSAIRRVRLFTNGGTDIFNVSGVGNFYLLQNFQELEGINGRQTQNQGGTVPLTATTYNLDLVIPVMLNLHDPIGLIMLQNEQLQMILSVEWETDAAVILTGGGTISAGTAIPYIEFFTPPVDPASYPNLSVIHQIIEDQINIAGTGDYQYVAPRGNTYLQLLFAYGVAASGAADNWSKAIMRVNQNDILYPMTPELMTMLMSYRQGLTRVLGVVPFDFLASDGLGTYLSSRDYVDSGALTDFQMVLTATSTGTLYVIRRMIAPLHRV